jgi:ArsR family transcriptional regulator, arsenate/arsenite/antimonite-responsive transcriptional repressor
MNTQIRFFRALSSEPRMKILVLLKEHPQCVNVIARRLGMGQPAVSQHLRVLREAGLVKARKRGTWMHYEANGAAIEAQGKALGGLFGGWISVAAAGAGTRNCPPELIAECGARNKGGTAARKRKGGEP